MKTIIFKQILYFLVILNSSFLILNCNDSSNPTNNNQTPPCVKFDTLVYPPNDTLYSNPPDTIHYKWLKATCTPVRYNIQISHDSIFSPSYTISWDIPDTFTQFPYLSYYAIWWRVKALYGSPVTDSFTTSSFRYRY